MRRDIHLGDSIYLLYLNIDKTLFHMFYSCEVVLSIWSSMCHWLGIDQLVEHISLANLNLHFKLVCKIKFKVEFHYCLWLVVCWVLWASKNAILFYKGRLVEMDILGSIKTLTREWLLAKYRVVVDVISSVWQTKPSYFLVGWFLCDLYGLLEVCMSLFNCCCRFWLVGVEMVIHFFASVVLFSVLDEGRYMKILFFLAKHEELEFYIICVLSGLFQTWFLLFCVWLHLKFS